MYFEEKIIDGVLCFRNRPDADWTRYSIQQLSLRCVELEKTIAQLRDSHA